MTRPPLTRRLRGEDDGVALPMVLGAMMVLTAFMLTSLALVLGNTAPSRADQDSKAALAAAQAGVDEYVSRLSATGGQYWVNGNTDASNDAFTATGTPVPGTGGDGAKFRYQVLTSAATTAQDGYLTLKVTGTSAPPGGGRQVERTLTVRLEPSAFIDYVYFTDYETVDPSLIPGVTAAEQAACSKYHYDGRPSTPCRDIQWVTGDVVDGPLHSNDALWLTGAPLFASARTESSWVKTTDPATLWRGGGTPSAGTAAQPGYKPVYEPKIDLPDGNAELLKYVRPKTDTGPNPDTDAARPGCLYKGATRITFVGNQMKVYSPNTTDAPARCLTVASNGSEQTKAIPPVIHVVPATGTCTGVGYPRTDEHVYSVGTTDYDKCRGTAFVQGRVDGQVTVSAQDDVVVTADLTVDDGATETDVIGLVAGNYVWVYHPVRSDGSNLLPDAETVRNIEAAVLSLRHSFVVQNWFAGAPLSSATPASKLRVHGAIAQKFRGAVGTGSGTSSTTGYLKNYVYDKRFQVLQPPYFLTPKNAPWRAIRLSDG